MRLLKGLSQFIAAAVPNIVESEKPGMTAASPVPVHPRLGVRMAYRLQRVLRPNAGYRWLSVRIEASKTARALFTGAERQSKADLFGCRMCGQCALPVTGYVCPMGCPKELRNGPCGGVAADGSCEVYSGLRCVWVEAYGRAASQDRAGDLRLLHRPVDHRRWGQSSWLNCWQGRDEQLRTGGPGPAGPRTGAPGTGGWVGSSHTQSPALGGS